MEIIKYPKRQDCHYKQTPGSSNETSINLSTDIMDMLVPNGVAKGECVPVTLTLFRDDFIRALCYIIQHLPLYQTRSGGSYAIQYSYEFFKSELDNILGFFAGDIASYTVTLYYREDGRVYLKDLSVMGFNLRKFLVEDRTAMHFITTVDNQLRLVLSDKLDDSTTPVSLAAPTPPVKSPKKKLAVTDSVLKDFIYKVIYLCDKIDHLKSFEKYMFGGEPNIQIKKENEFNLPGMFIKCDERELHRRNTPRRRWYDYPFTLKGETVYLTTQWYGSDEFITSYNNFVKAVETCYKGKFEFANAANGDFELWEI